MKELRDIGFYGDVRIPGEIQGIKADIIAGLDVRELKFVSIGLVLAIIDAIIVFGIFGQFGTVAVFSPAFFFVPFFCVAKIKKNGMYLEDYFWIWYSNSIKSRAVRINSLKNEYERLEELHTSKHRLKVSKKGAKKKQKEIKMKIKASKYKGSC